MRKKYSDEFKQKMINKVVIEDKSIVSVSKEYGLGLGTLNTWIKKYRSDQSLEDVQMDDELLKAQRKIKELERENEFLKKASAFFAKESQKDSNL